MNSKSPVFWVLAFVLLTINIFADGFELLINLISLTGIGIPAMLLNFVIDPVVGMVTSLILIIMGGLSFRSLARRLVVYGIGFLSEFIPGIDILPLRTVTVAIAIFLMVKEDKDNEQEAQQSQEKEESSVTSENESQTTQT